MVIKKWEVVLVACLILQFAARVGADPCGMVPPILAGKMLEITRVGHQRTYVFHHKGMETFVIQPGFTGNVRDFGMLIPFPNPPAIRKVSDDVFEHIANAIAPPEVVVDVTPKPAFFGGGGGFGGFGGGLGGGGGFGGGRMVIEREEVRVVREGAGWMKEVAVRGAVTSAAVTRWLG